MLRFLESCVRDEAYAPIQASISKILESNGSEFQSVLLRPVRNALDLDLLWAEFLATGEKEPVFRIIEVFNRPDLLREKLQEWLNTERPGFRRWRAKRRLARLPGSFGLRLEPAGTRVATLEDLDCRLALDGVQTVPGRADKIRALLPVQFGAEDLNYIWVKGAAKWSVASNACKHPIVLAACEEAKTQTLGAQLTLLEIRAEVCLQRWHPLEAAKILKEYVHLNPNDSFIAGKQANAARGVVLFPGQE